MTDQSMNMSMDLGCNADLDKVADDIMENSFLNDQMDMISKVNLEQLQLRQVQEQAEHEAVVEIEYDDTEEEFKREDILDSSAMIFNDIEQNSFLNDQIDQLCIETKKHFVSQS